MFKMSTADLDARRPLRGDTIASGYHNDGVIQLDACKSYSVSSLSCKTSGSAMRVRYTSSSNISHTL